MKTEVVIIGGGIVGCSAAYYLAQRGRRVMVLEKDPGVGLQASGRNVGGVRQHGREATLPLAMQAVKEIWPSLAKELECELDYVRTGNLVIACDKPSVEILEHELTREHSQGLDEVRMVTAAECREMVPELTDRVLAGKFCPTDGVANPLLVTPAFARAAQRLGAHIWTKTQVAGLLRQGDVVRGVTTNKGEIEAEVVINAAGPWATRFNAMAGYETPIVPRRGQVLVTERLPHKFTTWVSSFGGGLDFYLRQTNVGSIIIGINSKPTKSYELPVDYYDIAQQASRVITAMPWLGEVSLVRTYAGLTEYTPDFEAFIGAVPGAPGLYVAAGFCGEGYGIGPIVGKVLTDLLLGDKPCVSLAPFEPGRKLAHRNIR
jgi:sarcosine oxidase subunit beta